MFKNSGLYNPVRNPKTSVVLAQMRKEILLKKKKETQSLPITLDFKLEAIERRSATYFREYLRDYMKNGLMKTRSPTDLIMTSTKMD
jgi:penicillin-binding protein 1A